MTNGLTKSSVHPELPTAALRSSQTTHAVVDNSAPFAIGPESTYKSGKAVQTSGATSKYRIADIRYLRSRHSMRDPWNNCPDSLHESDSDKSVTSALKAILCYTIPK